MIVEEIMEKDVYFHRFLKKDGMYEPVGETCDFLPSGFYKPYFNAYDGKYYLTVKNVVMPKLFILPNGVQDLILKDIYRFWESEEVYKKFGSVYKRNILLYSVPGNGKTSLINVIANKLISEYNGVVIFIDSPNDLGAYGTVMERFRQIEPTRKVLTIIEDFERLAKNDDYTALLLQTLDGNAQLSNVVTIATTNYPESLDKRFVCRPSRFNLSIEYKKPNDEIRHEYIRLKLAEGGYDISDEDINRYVAMTEGYTFDLLKEFVQGIFVDGIDENEIQDRLKQLIDADGNIRINEETTKIGFSTQIKQKCKEEDCSLNAPCGGRVVD